MGAGWKSVVLKMLTVQVLGSSTEFSTRRSAPKSGNWASSNIAVNPPSGSSLPFGGKIARNSGLTEPGSNPPKRSAARCQASSINTASSIEHVKAKAPWTKLSAMTGLLFSDGRHHVHVETDRLRFPHGFFEPGVDGFKGTE